MPTERESFLPLMWVNGQNRNNVVVLTTEVLYLAKVKQADLARIDLGLEGGQPADGLLPAKAWKLPLVDITRIQFKQVLTRSAFEESGNKDLTVSYRDGSKVRNLKLTLTSEVVRDEVVQKLNDRVGPWPISETNVAAWLILARYVYIITVFALLTFFFSWLEVSNYWNRANTRGAFGSLVNRYLDAFGVWGIVGPGMLAAVVALAGGIRQIRTPPIIVTYEPDQEAN